MSYGAKCWPVKRREETKVHVAEMCMLRRMCGTIKSEWIKSEYTRLNFQMAEIERKNKNIRSTWRSEKTHYDMNQSNTTGRYQKKWHADQDVKWSGEERQVIMWSNWEHYIEERQVQDWNLTKMGYNDEDKWVYPNLL